MKAFISYSHKDAELLTKLHEHLAALRRQGLLDTWTDREISAGGVIDDEVNSQIEDADVYLLLISAAFIDSHYCIEREFARALERQRSGTAKIIPVIVRECDWGLPELRKFKALPEDGKAVLSRHWHSVDEAFANVALGLRSMLVAPSVSRPAPRAKASTGQKSKFEPDERHVTSEEKEALRSLCADVVERLTIKTVFESEEAAKRKKGKFYGIVWSQFHEQFGTGELAELLREQYADARSWFVQYRASKDRNLKRVNPQKFRNTLTKAIYSISGELGWTKDQVFSFAAEKVGYEGGIKSLNDLGNQQLELLRDRIRYEKTKLKVKSGQAAARNFSE